MRPQNAAAALAALLVTVAAGGAAEARILDFRGGVRVGGMGGWGSSSTTPDFFNDTSGFGRIEALEHQFPAPSVEQVSDLRAAHLAKAEGLQVARLSIPAAGGRKRRCRNILLANGGER